MISLDFVATTGPLPPGQATVAGQPLRTIRPPRRPTIPPPHHPINPRRPIHASPRNPRTKPHHLYTQATLQTYYQVLL